MTTSNDELELLRELFSDEPPPDAQAWSAMRQRLATSTDAAGTVELRGSLSQGEWVRSLSWRRIVCVAAAFILLVAGTFAVLAATRSPQGSRTSVITSHTPWRLASMVGTAAPFVATTSAAQSPDQITCPSASVCYVTTRPPVSTPGQSGGASTSSLPSAYVSTDAGSSWQALVMPPNVVLDTAFSCPTVDECLIGAQEGTVISGQLSVGRGVVANSEPQLLLTTTNGGATWSEHNVPITPILGSNPVFDSDLSGTWGQLTQLSCFDANTCDAFGLAPSDQEEEPIGQTGNTVTRNVFLQTTNGGITWSTYDFPWVANPDGSAGWSSWQPATFSCATAQDCVGMSWAVTGNASQVSTEFSWMTTDGGATWTRAWLPKIGDSLSNVRSISRPDAAHCVAVGAYGAAGTAWLSFIATTSDGGSTWTIETP